MYHSNCQRIVRVIHRLATERIVSSPSRRHGLIEQPRREYHLEEIVEYHNPSEIERFAILHDFRTQNLDEVDVEKANAQSWEWAAHQEPIVDPRIALVIHEVSIAIVNCSHNLRHLVYQRGVLVSDSVKSKDTGFLVYNVLSVHRF